MCLCFSHDVVRGLIEAQDETDTTEEGINYVAMRNLFVREAKEAMEVKVEKKTRTTHIRESAERIELNKTVKPVESNEDSYHYCTFSLSIEVHGNSLHPLNADGRVVRVPQENEPGQPDTPSGVYRQAPWADNLGRQHSEAALHPGWVAQTQGCLVRCSPNPPASIWRSEDPKQNKPAVFPPSLRYKNNVLIDAKAHPEKYTAESNYNMHSLEIKK